VIFTQNFTDDTSRFFEWGICANAHVFHSIQDAAVDGLETIAHIWQGAGDDDAHGVIEVSRTHLIIDADGF